MDANEQAILIALLASLPGIGGLIWQALKEKRRAPVEDASTAVATSESASKALRNYSDEVLRLRAELLELRTEMDALREREQERDMVMDQWRAGIKRLIAQLVSLGAKPVWEPEPEGKRPGPGA